MKFGNSTRREVVGAVFQDDLNSESSYITAQKSGKSNCTVLKLSRFSNLEIQLHNLEIKLHNLEISLLNNLEIAQYSLNDSCLHP